MKLGRWGCWILNVGLLVCTTTVLADATTPAVTRINLASATLTVQGQQGEQRELSLPHRWDNTYAGFGGQVTYSVVLPKTPATGPLAVFIPRVGNQAEIRLDGLPLVRLGALDNSGYDASKSPVWLALPTLPLGSHGPRHLDIVVSAQAGRWGGLSEMYFGPVAAVKPLFDHHFRWRQDVGVLVVVALLLMGSMAGGLWLRQREAPFGLFAFAAFFGAIRMADRIQPVPPLPWPLWGAVTAVAYALHLLFVAQFAVHVVGVSSEPFRRVLRACAVGAGLAAALSFLVKLPSLWTLTLGLLLVPGVIALALVGWQAWRTRSTESLLMLIAGSIAIVVGLRDYVWVRIISSDTTTFSWMPVATFVLALFMAWIIVERYSRQVHQYRDLSETLEQKVMEREVELDRTYQQLKVQGETQAALQERQRIMRDIHDGVGAHLVGLLSLVRKGNVPASTLEDHTKATLDELRIAVDSLQPVNGDLATVLATMRYRLQPRFQAAGLELVWDVAELPFMASLTPQRVLDIQRLLLEAFTNVLRHAHASRLEVSARPSSDPHCLSIVVADNGVGWPSGDVLNRGHGIRNMQVRATSLGAKLTMDERPGGGARLTLELLVA